MKTFNLKSFATLAVLVGLVSSVSVAHADNQKKKNWDKNHPRRAEVNKRLNNQQKRVDQGLSSGKLTDQQANKIQNQDQHIRQQEQRDAAQNGGHITKREQRQLNREENGVSREINRDERGNSKAAAPVSAPVGQ
jgi:hypothetical protein